MHSNGENPDLEKAEVDLDKALKDLEKAEHEIEDAKQEIEEAKKEPLVEFEDVNSLETVTFHTSWETTLAAAWDKAAHKLKEPRKPDDRLQSASGHDLMPYLSLTLRELIDKKIVKALSFQIVGPTGGAYDHFW
ncbi:MULTISPECIES: hypothetical protein [Bradyrhizobium]|uniref:Uncharacterized protein n=1 Tax=Bradyrhizobium ottawaense TaxID=931866 RepID=A0ABV4FHM5_9BRAD|nr:hypothetical protein [Bradyrhizobium sp. CCBAU 15615]